MHATHALVQDFRWSVNNRVIISLALVCAPFQVPEDGSRFPAAETSKSKYHLFFQAYLGDVTKTLNC